MRTKYCVGTVVLVTLLIMAPFAHVLSDPVTEKQTGSAQAAGEARAESSGTTSSESPAAGSAEVKPADPFVPSESISADSAISFPVDI